MVARSICLELLRKYLQARRSVNHGSLINISGPASLRGRLKFLGTWVVVEMRRKGYCTHARCIHDLAAQHRCTGDWSRDGGSAEPFKNKLALRAASMNAGLNRTPASPLVAITRTPVGPCSFGLAYSRQSPDEVVSRPPSVDGRLRFAPLRWQAVLFAE